MDLDHRRGTATCRHARLVAQGRNGDLAVAPSADTARAFMGDLAENATASGQVVAGRQAGLSLAGSGEVNQVNVTVGDAVTAGDELIRLDTSALERTVASVELDVATAKAELADLTAAPVIEDLAAAEEAVPKREARLDDLLDGPSEEEIAASQAGVRAAEARVDSAGAESRPCMT